MKVKNLVIVVDGKEVPEGEINNYLSSPEKIQSITVIKDMAKVKALYGYAANGKQGAIIITTKKWLSPDKWLLERLQLADFSSAAAFL